MIVVDSSALVLAVVDTTGRGAQVRARLDDGASAPHLVDAEVGQAIRGLVRRDALGPDAAERSLGSAARLVTDRFAHPPFQARAWELRDNVSFYDALYVALAELLRVPLVTADVWLTQAPGPRCSFETV
ncbi:MAG: type II toxin-antitoxin system VapC family toxin [Actinomycetota bacterium]|nr:type II toxin-antitoxin system VapC family toxin [Actinomycetota bacterium]